MANKEQLAILKSGVENWNQWRQDNRDVRIDLSSADLSHVDLSYANLRDANLNHANLNRAILSHADLSRVYLSHARLHSVHFSNANLTVVDLSYSDLSYADFSHTNLSYADFSHAILSHTNFREAYLSSTILVNIDLNEAKGLETVTHHGPSSIGVDTLYRSQGKIPEVFLRGVGLEDDFIACLSSFTNQAIDFYSCFISYSHADKSFAQRLHDQLQGRGIRCWLDEKQLLPGDEIYSTVDRGIRLWDKVLLCCSKDSLTSWWVSNEIDIAFDKEQQLWRERKEEVRALIPLNLDGHMFTDDWQSGKRTQVKQRMAADFTGWEENNAKFEEQLEAVIRALRADSGGREQPPKPKL